MIDEHVLMSRPSAVPGPRPRHRPRSRAASWLLLSLAALLPDRSAAGEPPWRKVTEEDGITVTAREMPGRGFPTFRGVGMIEANLYDVLGVLSDVPRYTHWMYRCRDSRQVHKVSEMEYIVYSRTRAPWPVADRDAVYHSTVHVDIKQMIIDIRFRAVKHPKVPPVDGVVRMERLQGHFKLTARGPTRTLMDYQVDADPGGLVPTWLAKLATRRLPMDSIQSLRRRVQVTRGWYAERIKRWQAMAREMSK